jgi:hypothetical protein
MMMFRTCKPGGFAMPSSATGVGCTYIQENLQLSLLYSLRAVLQSV